MRRYRSRCEVRLDGELVPFTLVRTTGRRGIDLVVDPDGGLELRAPYHFRGERAHEVIVAHAAWVLERLADGRRRRERRAAALAPGGRLPFLGEWLELAVRTGPRRRVERIGARLEVAGGAGGGQPPPLAALVEAWYRAEARRHFAARVAALGRRLGGPRPARITVRGQRTVWGSCSSRGTLSLNWRLMLLEADLVDYVVLHELCHLVELNHSARFWARLGALMPDYRERIARLQRAQATLPL